MTPTSAPEDRSTASPVLRLTGPLRTRLAQSLRSRVAGPTADARAADIWGTPGPRWFTPDDVIWRVHADASMFVGGIRALLLQSLHPLAMAGVAGHSGYRGDPLGSATADEHLPGNDDVRHRRRRRAGHRAGSGRFTTGFGGGPRTAAATGRQTHTCSAGSTSPWRTAS